MEDRGGNIEGRENLLRELRESSRIEGLKHGRRKTTNPDAESGLSHQKDFNHGWTPMYTDGEKTGKDFKPLMNAHQR